MANPNRTSARFGTHWQTATDDNNLTLYGFHRFKTTHLLSLRYLEDEIADLDHVVYQAGIRLSVDHSPSNRLGLKDCQKDSSVPPIEATITDALVLKLRTLLKEYGASNLNYFALHFLHNLLTIT